MNQPATCQSLHQQQPHQSLSLTVYRRLYWFLLCLWLVQTRPALAQESSETGPYALSWKTDASLLGIGVATGITTLISDNQARPLTLAEVNSLNRSQVNAFDRGATYRYSSQAGTISDQALNGAFLVAGVVAVPSILKAKRQWLVVPMMFLETVLLPTTIQQTVKNVFPRNRPFVYNPDAPLDQKLTKNGHQSFFSGHSGTSFATAVFTAEMFRHYFPHSKLKPLVWIVGLGLATTVSIERYEAGRHFPTDIITGAVLGSALGWGIPKLHEVRKQSSSARRFTLQPWSTGHASGVFARLTI